MEGFAMSSKLERVEKENLDLKTERTSLMAKLGNQRRYPKEVQVVHKQRLAASNEAAKAAEDRAIEIEIVYNMYRMRRFTPNTVCAGYCLWALPTMPYKKLTSQG
jgi:allophanate hydrolase subunit 1